MYWIEVFFENGKTLRKETVDLNASFAVYCRYANGRGKPRVQMIKAGYDDATTLELCKVEGVAI